MTFRRLAPDAAALLILSATATAAPAGGGDRHAIMDALRRTGDLPDRVFVVRSLHVSGGWAWAEVDPQSRDGRQHYESEAALLHRGAHGWQVVDQPCEEESCDAAREMARIRHAHPAAPAAIFAH